MVINILDLRSNMVMLTTKASWRLAFGQSGVLGFFLNLIAGEEADEDLISHALRLIGNSCADIGPLKPHFVMEQIL